MEEEEVDGVVVDDDDDDGRGKEVGVVLEKVKVVGT